MIRLRANYVGGFLTKDAHKKLTWIINFAEYHNIGTHALVYFHNIISNTPQTYLYYH